MNRKDFIKKTSLSTLFFYNLNLLDVFSASDYHKHELKNNEADFNGISAEVKQRFDELINWMQQNGWGQLLNTILETGVDLKNLELSELIKKREFKRSIGFDDFAGVKLIEPGFPARSILYHLLASPRVKSGMIKSYPQLEQLDALEDFIYAIQKFTITKEELNNNYVLAMFAYEYRPAFKTPHHAHADLVFSRTGIARIGDSILNYDKADRSFTNEPLHIADKKRVAVTPARYALFLAKIVKGSDVVNEHPEITLLGKEKDDKSKIFLQPVRKIFKNDLLINNSKLEFKEYHRNEKLQGLVKDVKGRLINPTLFDLNQPPFFVDSNNSKSLVQLNVISSSILVTSVPTDLVREAYQAPEYLLDKNQAVKRRLFYEIPKTLGEDKNRYFNSYTTLQVGDEELLHKKTNGLYEKNVNPYNEARNNPLFVNIKYKKDEESSDHTKHLATKATTDEQMIIGLFEDNICDGSVNVVTSNLYSDKIPATLLQSCIPAFSIVTAPDFFPQVDSFDLLKYDVDTYINEGAESNFFEGGLNSLSAARKNPNPHSINFPTLNSKNKGLLQTYTSVVSDAPDGTVQLDPAFKYPYKRDYRSTGFLPDVCSFVFAPGWDITYANDDAGENPELIYLSTKGLGSPFAEDMKLCAAMNGMWPAASPDAARTYQGSLVKDYRNPTAIPLLDMEIGYHQSSPYVIDYGHMESFGWDGEQGPFITKKEKGYVVNFTDLGRADLILNALKPATENGSLDMSQLREVTSFELIQRMEALKNAVKIIDECEFIKSHKDHKVTAYTKLWLVSAEKVADWQKNASGFGIPKTLAHLNLTLANNNMLKGEGYLYIFVMAGKDIGYHDFKKSEEKRREQKCKTMYVCQITADHFSYCKLNSKGDVKKAWQDVKLGV